MDKQQLLTMSQTDITTLDPAQLADITGVNINPDAPETDRLNSYLLQIKNPYCFRVKDTPVRVRFKNNKPPINAVLEGYFAQYK